MKCFCKEESFDLKLEADFVPDPLWCNKCGCNLDTDDLLLSNEVKADIRLWLNNYENLLHDEKIPDNYTKLHDQHNDQGLKLAKIIQEELGDKYTIEYHSS